MKTLAAPSRIRLLCFLSILLTFMALAPYGFKHRLGMRLRGYLDGQILLRAIVPSEHHVQVQLPKTSYSGVILWPDAKKTRKIVAPSPVSNLFPKGHMPRSEDSLQWRLLVFQGARYTARARCPYPAWQSNESRCPLDRLAAHPDGSTPEPGTPINLNCCSQIRVAIQNADNRPGTIALGVILTNTRLAGKPSISLGREPVTSSHPVRFSIDRTPVSEVLDFRIPANPKIRQFDQLTVVFKPSPERALGGVKIAIKQFMLVPKGL